MTIFLLKIVLNIYENEAINFFILGFVSIILQFQETKSVDWQ
jgi:hypothetical protein